MKGKLLKKLKTVKQIGYLNPDRILQVGNLDGFVDNFHLKSTFVDNFPFKSHSKSHPSPQSKPKPKPEKTAVIDAEELIKEMEDVKEEIDKENVYPSISKHEKSRYCSNELKPICELNKEESDDNEVEKSSSCCKELKKEEGFENEKENSSSKCEKLTNESDSVIDTAWFRRPDMDSISLFDPKLLLAFEEAVEELKRNREEAQLETTNSKNHKYPFFQPEDQNDALQDLEDQNDPLQEFDEKCPPGGNDSVIFYTTSLRGIRKTFEDCQSIRFLLESFGLVFYERDVSIHSRFRDELWEVMGEKCLPPRLFIRGRYIGGAEQVLRLNEQGKLKALFRDIPIDFSEGPCNVCSGLRFMLCYNCNGSRKVFEYDDDNEGGDGEEECGGVWSKCLQCNENGLVVCPLC